VIVVPEYDLRDRAINLAETSEAHVAENFHWEIPPQ
jgi:hypothetical protein